MRRLSLIVLLFVTVVFIASSFKPFAGSVRGTVTPAEAGLRAFLFSAKDTVNANINNGAFLFSNVPSGNYKLLVEAAPPYRNGTKDGIVVSDGQYTDAGQLELLK